MRNTAMTIENGNKQAVFRNGASAYAQAPDLTEVENHDLTRKSTATRYNEPLITDGPATCLLDV